MKVLIVDDDAEYRFLLRYWLERAGHEVVHLQNGARASSTCETLQPDLVLLDLFMPGTDGFETLKDLRESHPGLNILVLSNGAGAARFETLLQASKYLGAAFAIPKPATSGELLAALRILDPKNCAA